MFPTARFVAAAALATAALLAHDDVDDIGNGIGAVNGGSAVTGASTVEDDLDAIDDDDWVLW